MYPDVETCFGFDCDNSKKVRDGPDIYCQGAKGYLGKVAVLPIMVQNYQQGIAGQLLVLFTPHKGTTKLQRLLNIEQFIAHSKSTLLYDNVFKHH